MNAENLSWEGSLSSDSFIFALEEAEHAALMIKEFECTPPSSSPSLLNTRNEKSNFPESSFGSTLEVPEMENFSSSSDSCGTFTSSSVSSTFEEPEIVDISSSTSVEILSPVSTSEKNSSTNIRSCKCEKNKIDEQCIWKTIKIVNVQTVQ